MDQNEMSNLYRGHSIDASYQVSYHLAQVVSKEKLLNLVGSTYGRFCINFPQSRMKGERHRLSPLSL
jgi:hypothetical protein